MKESEGERRRERQALDLETEAQQSSRWRDGLVANFEAQPALWRSARAAGIMSLGLALVRELGLHCGWLVTVAIRPLTQEIHGGVLR